MLGPADNVKRSAERVYAFLDSLQAEVPLCHSRSGGAVEAASVVSKRNSQEVVFNRTGDAENGGVMSDGVDGQFAQDAQKGPSGASADWQPSHEAGESEYVHVVPDFDDVCRHDTVRLSGDGHSEIFVDSLEKTVGLSAYGFALVAVGGVASVWIPIIKPIFTLSFTALAMGCCVLALGVLYALTDVFRLRRGLGLVLLFGRFSLVAYMVGCFFDPVLDSLVKTVGAGIVRVSGTSGGFVEAALASVALVLVLVAWKRMVLVKWGGQKVPGTTGRVRVVRLMRMGVARGCD